jgi:hypothetical protein
MATSSSCGPQPRSSPYITPRWTYAVASAATFLGSSDGKGLVGHRAVREPYAAEKETRSGDDATGTLRSPRLDQPSIISIKGLSIIVITLTEAESSISGLQATGSSILSFGMTFYSPELPEQLVNLRSLSYPLDSSTVDFTDDSAGSDQHYMGVVTSIELISAPEPSALAAFFVMFGAAAVVHRRGRSPRDLGTQ